MKTKVQVNTKSISDKIFNVVYSTLTPDSKLEIANVYAKMCDPYVPFLEGPLSQTVQVYPDYLHYIQPYAHYQYVGEDFNHTIDYHPRATAYWDKVMMAEHGDEFKHQVRRIIIRRAKEAVWRKIKRS